MLATRSAGLLGALPAVALGLLPKLTCPLCWPAYTAALAALGFGFADYTPYLMPLTAVVVSLIVMALAWTSLRRGTPVPAIVGAFAGVVLMLGKFALESDAITYAAAALLVFASFLPLRWRTSGTCPRCVPDQTKTKETA
jgi:hypothetical protein